MKHEAQTRIKELRGLIEKTNRDYYDLHQPTVGDRDYGCLAVGRAIDALTH